MLDKEVHRYHNNRKKDLKSPYLQYKNTAHILECVIRPRRPIKFHRCRTYMYEDIKGIIMKLAEHLQASLNQTGTTVSHHRSGLVREPNCTALIHYYDFLLIL